MPARNLESVLEKVLEYDAQFIASLQGEGGGVTTMEGVTGHHSVAPRERQSFRL
jgi:hypothetical protein